MTRAIKRENSHNVSILISCSLTFSSCIIYKNQTIDNRMEEIELTLEPLGGESKVFVLKKIEPLELGEPAEIRAIDNSTKEYEFHRKYVGGIGGYDEVLLVFTDGRLSRYFIDARR